MALRRVQVRRTSVRPGGAALDEAELARVRDELPAEVAGLRVEIDKAESEIADRLRDAVGDAGDDQADAGPRHSSGNRGWRLPTTPRALSRRAERALARIDEGTYGTASPVASHRKRGCRRSPGDLVCGIQAARGSR